MPFKRSEAPSSSSASKLVDSPSSEILSNSVLYSTDPAISQTLLSSSSPTSTDPTKYDVFLSFCGKDTRFKFTAHLYAALDRHGIKTFKDDPELPTGDVITDALRQAIRDSKIYVVVFSENYAFSPWCLDELVEIYDCYKEKNRLVIGVYCNIDPSVVRHQRESFEKAFKKHETDRFIDRMDKVNKWRSTLTNVAAFSGKPISLQRSEVDTIDEIVDVILHKINPKTLHVAKYPVGLDYVVKDITILLNSGSKEGVIKFGIYGMGGLGKTTLAKALYNQLLLESFKDCCFLANVREISGTLKGLESLQQQLINDILRSKANVVVHNVDKGTELIRARLCSTKILVVTDDVDDCKQFESLVGPFAPGSLVIITTRDKELLDRIEVEARYQYPVKELDDNESLTLFNRHAFGNAKPDDNFTVFSRDILDHARGLPLALEVFGSSLYKQPVVGWKSFIDKLQRIPNSTIQQRLIISLDVLDDPMLKKLFLDIACLFIGSSKEWVVQKMECYYSFVDYNIDLLKNRCLLTINHDGVLRMHDLLRDMGRDIVRNNYPDEPEKHSRLFVSQDITNVLMNYKGTKAIEVIYLKDSLKGESLAAATFKHMSKLRFLYLECKVNITGNFEHIFEDLRWFYWNFCPLKHLPSSFCPPKLVILELPHSKMTTMQEPHMVPGVFLNLKTLNMSNSKDLGTTPDFTNMPCLETLDLKGCESLEELHTSIGSLVKLVSLDLYGCSKLRSLPDSICNLGALKCLNIDSCINLQALPSRIGDMKYLIELDASGLTVLNIPDSIGRLSKLVHLTLSWNRKLKTLPDSICDLRALEELDISCCSSLKVLPKELGSIVSLKILEAGGLGVLKLPDSVGHLTKLVHLDLCGNKKLETLPDSICNLIALEVVCINSCSSLKALPVEFGNIELLKELDFCNGNIYKLPDSIGRLSRVVRLDLSRNRNLEILPDSICNMKSLETLNISACQKLEKLPDQLWKLTGLRKINASGATLLKKLPDVEPSQIALSLQSLDLSKTGLRALPSGISQLSKLKYLDLSGCEHLLFITELPPNLRGLLAAECRSMERLPNLSNLIWLNKLDLKKCSGLIEIVGLEELTCLEELFLPGCKLSCVTNTLTKNLIQIYSEFGCGIVIVIDEPAFPIWISRASLGRGSRLDIDWIWTSRASLRGESRMDIDLPLNLSFNPLFLGIILCFEELGWFGTITIKNTARDIIWTRYCSEYSSSAIVIVPRSMLSLTDEDHTIEITADKGGAVFLGVHILYKD